MSKALRECVYIIGTHYAYQGEGRGLKTQKTARAKYASLPLPRCRTWHFIVFGGVVDRGNFGLEVLMTLPAPIVKNYWGKTETFLLPKLKAVSAF